MKKAIKYYLMRCLNYKAKTVFFFLYNLIIFVSSLVASLLVNINITPRTAAVQRKKKVCPMSEFTFLYEGENKSTKTDHVHEY